MGDEITSFSNFKLWCEGVSPYAFEEIVAEIFRDMGREAETTPRTNDGGVDVIVYDEPAGLEGTTSTVDAIVQTKLQTGIYDTVDPDVLPKLEQAAPEYDPDRLVIVSSGKYTSTIKQQVVEITEYDVELLQLEDLYQMARDETISTLVERHESRPGRKNWW